MLENPFNTLFQGISFMSELSCPAASVQTRSASFEGPAYILHTRPWRETSLLFDVFTLEQGRLSLIGRGARGTNRTGRAGGPGRAPPFQRLILHWENGRGEIGQLREARELVHGARLRGKPLACAFYLNELLVRLLPKADPLPGLFADYGDALLALGEEGARLDTPLRRFEKRLLEHLGYLPDFDCVMDTGALPEAGRMYYFAPELGVLEQTPAPGVLPVAGDVLAALVREDFADPRTARGVRTVLARALAPHLGSRPLKSRELWPDT